MKQSFKNIIKALIYKFSKVRKKRLVFSSLDGHYSDSPRYISEKIHELDSSYEIIWLLKPEYAKELPEYIKWYDINTIMADRVRGSASALIDNVYCNRSFTMMDNSIGNRVKSKVFKFLYTKEKQPGFTTWHATPLKCVGRDQIGNETIQDFVCPNVTMILGNQYSIDILNHTTFYKLNMKLLGTPRNDILFKNNLDEIKEKLGLPKEKKIILFAPTFRNDGRDVEGKNIKRSGINQIEEINFEKLFRALNDKFGGDWIFVCRFHYHVASMVDWKELETRYSGKIVNGNECDEMANYLICADILITDASSCAFDFSLTQKPCFLFFPDYQYYKTKERGFYIDIEKLPFPLSCTFEKLLDDVSKFDTEQYQTNLRKMLVDMGYVDDENSSVRVGRYILNSLAERDK